MLTTSARLLAILGLFQSRRDWTGAELAARLGVTGRTIRRDVERLRDLDYPIDARPGVAGGYRLGPGGTLPPLLLDDQEAVAVAIGLQGATQSGVTGVGEAALRALVKLDQVLPSRVRHTVRGLRAAIVTTAPAGPEADLDVLLAITSAVREGRRLRVDYQSHDGTQSRRELEPHRVVQSGRRWYLVAWDVERDDWRTFRADRLSPRPPLGARFAPREAPAADVAGYTAEGVTTRVYPYRIRLIVDAPAAEVGDRLGPLVGVVTPRPDGRCDVLLGAQSLDEAAVYLGTSGFELVVREPIDLRDHLAVVAGRLSRAAVAPDDDGAAGAGDSGRAGTASRVGRVSRVSRVTDVPQP